MSIKTTEELRLEINAGDCTSYPMKIPNSINELIRAYKQARKDAGLLRMNKDDIIFLALQKGFPVMLDELHQEA